MQEYCQKTLRLLLVCVLLSAGCDTGKIAAHNTKPIAQEPRRIMSQVKKWLDTLTIDPLLLRSYGIKGKKKLVELFEAYASVYNFVSDDERISVNQRLSAIAKITQELAYHDMPMISDEQFKEDATSYVRLCYLLEKRGFDTALYHKEIEKIVPRLNAQMPGRGVSQQLMFHRYYSYFNLPEPFPLEKSFSDSILANKIAPETLNEEDTYELTHEIFALYDEGNKMMVNFISPDAQLYLEGTLRKLAENQLVKKNLDLTGELVSCMLLLKMRRYAICKHALRYLISSQNPDGSFGNYEGLRFIYGDYVKEGFYLHTTTVILKALSLAFSKTLEKK